MGTLFINYRRGETAGEARALFNELAATLGKDSVFMDVDGIALGRDFRQVLHERLASCDLMLALIGRDWINSKDASGRRRLEDPTDFVRLEIEAALKRNIPVTPVLVQGAQMPGVEHLPEDIKDFAFRNGFELSHNRWESDLQELLKRLGLGKRQDPMAVRAIDIAAGKMPAERALSGYRGAGVAAPGAQQTGRTRRLVLVAASVVTIAVAGGGFLYYRTVVEGSARIDQSPADTTVNTKIHAEPQAAQASGSALPPLTVSPAPQEQMQRAAGATPHPGKTEKDKDAEAARASTQALQDQMQKEALLAQVLKNMQAPSTDPAVLESRRKLREAAGALKQ